MTTIPIGKTLLVWLFLIAVETIHGILRNLFLAPVVGDFRSRQIGVFVASALIVSVSCLTIRWMTRAAPLTTGALLGIGVLWTVLTLAFEFALGTAIGRPWNEMLAEYDLRQGGLMPFGVVILTCAPWIAAKLRARQK